MSTEGTGQPPPAPPPNPIQPVAPVVETVRDEDKIMLVLAYLFILSIIPLLTVKDSDFVRWHAKNGLVLAAIAIVIALLGIVPGILCVITCPLIFVICVLDLLAMMKALSGIRWRIPGVSDLADKL